MRRRKNPTPPPDFDDAIEGYRRFTTFEPQEVGHLDGLVIPAYLYEVGKAVHVLYRSDKWEIKEHDYIHDHDPGVHVCMPSDDEFEGKRVAVPDFIRQVETIYLLGKCLGFRFQPHEGPEIDAEGRSPYPELYAVPSGKALLVIETHKAKAKLVAAMWGGRLDIRSEGIVG